MIPSRRHAPKNHAKAIEIVSHVMNTVSKYCHTVCSQTSYDDNYIEHHIHEKNECHISTCLPVIVMSVIYHEIIYQIN